MKKIIFFFLFVSAVSSVFGQDDTPKKKKDIPDLSNRPNDHFLLQFGYTGWSGKPDSINTNGVSKSINAYFMFDFPFKTNPSLSMAFGPGISSDHILFGKTHVGIKENATIMAFSNVSDTNHFKKTKLATVYLEAPIEFRYAADPVKGKGLKWAIGVKVGTMLTAHTRNVKFQSKSGTSINDYTMKEASKRFFNKNRLSVMGRIGMGHISLYGSYQFTALLKDGAGPVLRPYSIGITLSGL